VRMSWASLRVWSDGAQTFCAGGLMPAPSQDKEPRFGLCMPYASPPGGVRRRVRYFLALQGVYLALGMVIYAALWAIEPESAHLGITVMYALCLCNLTALSLGNLSLRYLERKPLQFWMIYIGLLVALTPVIVTITAAIMHFGVERPDGPFWSHLESSWKFLAIVTIAFGIACQAYAFTRSRVERRNEELHHMVEQDIADRELHEQELKRAREMQHALFPKQIPQIDGFEIAGAWEPAHIVGGDCFDVIRLGANKVGVCVADVVGKGLPAALLMAHIQATVRAYAMESQSPAWICEKLNAELCGDLPGEKMVTLFYGILDSEQKTLKFTNAGHPHPILRRASGAMEQLETGGGVLGAFPEWKYEDSKLQMAPGDLVVLFTDGITEVLKPNGTEFGERALMHLVKSLPGEPPSKLNTKLLSEVRRCCQSPLQDDATLITIEAAAATATQTGPIPVLTAFD
jgi:phosphoserine phosphatase RsbU/P